MKSIAAILLAVLFLSQTFSIAFTELSKLDDLIEHARLHSEKYGDSFITFLSKHYGNQEKEHAGEHEEHDQLPFQHCHSVHLMMVFIGSSTQTITSAGISNPELTKNGVYRESIPKSIVEEIFQPPMYG